MAMHLTVVILAFNEEQHLKRCIRSLDGIANKIVVIDCHSTDRTVVIAEECGALVLQHEWKNHATQFNWALTMLSQDSEWVLRLDADEYLTPELQAEIMSCLPELGDEIDGVYFSRCIAFLGRQIRHGGMSPHRVLRLFRYGRGECENRWMDEHIKVAGNTVDFHGEIIDENLNFLTWWTDKHNKYASREAVDLLNLEYGFMAQDSVAQLVGGSQAGLTRWMKERIYARLPGGVRALAYFVFRYFFRLGILDGRAGITFHFLQGFWYRYLVDAKVAEVKRYIHLHKVGVPQAIQRVLNIDVSG